MELFFAFHRLGYIDVASISFPSLCVNSRNIMSMKFSAAAYDCVSITAAFGTVLSVTFVVFLLKLYRARSRNLKLKR